jgi:hypothetical protein
VVEQQNQSRWYVNRLQDGRPALLFQTNWKSGLITNEFVWNKRILRWQESRIIREHFLMPDVNIDEVDLEFAYEYFPDALKDPRFSLKDENLPSLTFEIKAD